MKLLRLLANLGYGSRREVDRLLRQGSVTNLEGDPLGERDLIPHDRILVHGQPLDPPSPLTILLNKPDGYTCSTDDPGSIVYDLLPPRFACRNPGLQPVGRLDKDTRGLLVMTDDGTLSHKIIHPKSRLGKVYRVTLDRPLEGSEAEIFLSGTLLLRSESRPLLPAVLTPLSSHEALITLHEGRYHQVRRMFAAVGNHVTDLQRVAIGSLQLPDDLPEGSWRSATPEELRRLLTPGA